MTDGYAMGRTSSETERLQVQANVLAPHSAHVFRLAGITEGMRVLDVGCGPGDVSLLMAELVGPGGSVIGVDMNPAVLEVAQARVAAAGLANVSFIEANLDTLRFDEPLDALVGRFILIHLAEPAAVVRTLSKQVRSGGVVSFQEYNVTRSRTVPSVPLIERGVSWIADALRAAGCNPDTGEQLTSILRDAGLTVAGAAAAAAGGTADSQLPVYLAESVRTVLPLLLGHGLATEDEVDVDTFADRFASELKQAGATMWCPDLVGAWARIP